MSSRKVADAHVQFTTKGLDAVKSDMDSLKADLKRLEAGRGRLKITPKFDARLSGIMELQRNLRVAIALNRELNRQSASKDIRRASNVIQAGISADRRNEQRLASGRAHTNISNRRDDALVASPALRRATETAVKQSLTALKSDRDSIAKTIAGSSTLSPAFKAKTAGVSHLNIQPSASSFQMRNEAQRIRDMIDSVKLFGRAGTKTAAEVNDFRENMEKLARSLEQAAKQADDLTAAQTKAKSLGVQGQGALRGSIRDEAMAKERVSAILGRQEGREFQKMSPREALDRRAVEIGNLKGQMNTFDRNQEVAMATEAIASSMRDLAQQIRESPIDNALTELAERFRSGAISEKDFRLGVMSRQAQRRGYQAAQSKIENAAFSAEHGGASQDTYAKSGEVNALIERKDAIDKLLVATGKMTAAEKEKLETERETIEAEIKHVKSQEEIATLIDKEEASLKKLITAKNVFIAKRAKGVALTKEEIREERQLDKQINESAKRMNTYTNAVYGGNVALNKAANSSRNFNFKMQQASYGVQDFVQVFGQTGLSGALRASANNMASFFAASGTPQGAIIGAVGTIAMIGLADAIKAVGWESETTSEKIAKLNARLSQTMEIQKGIGKFAENMFGGSLGDFESSIAAMNAGLSDISSLAMDRFSATEEAKNVSKETIKAEQTVSGERGVGNFIADTFFMAMREGVLDFTNVIMEDFDAQSIAEAKLTGGEDAARADLESQRSTLTWGGMVELDAEMESRYQRLEQEIVEANEDTAEGLLAIAEAFDSGSEDIKAAKAKLEQSSSRMKQLIRDQEDYLTRFKESISRYVNDSIESLRFGGQSAGVSASSSIVSAINKQKSKVAVAQNTLENTREGEARTAAELDLKQQQSVLAELIKSLNKLTAETSKLSTVFPGISTSISTSIEETSKKRREREAAVGPDQNYNRMASQMLMDSVSSMVMDFSGQVTRRIGETQEQANDRERKRLDDLIATIVASPDQGDDLVIPYLEMAKRKVGTSDKDAQSRTATTPIESLHQKIQDSLTGIDTDFDLQKEQRDLLKQIAANTGKVAHPDTSADALRRRADEQMPASGGSAVSTPPQPTPVPAGGGQMSVPTPQFQYDGTVLPGAQEKLGRTATNPEITGYKSAANHDAGLLEKMAAEGPIPMGNSDPDLYGMNRILDDAGKASASNVFNRGGRELSGHDNRSKKYKEIAARNAAARAGRMKPEGISDEQIDANVTRKMRDEGYTEFLQGTRSGAYKSSADSFYGARRAGAVSDFQRTGPKFVDDFPGARRGRGLTASQQQAIQRPKSEEFTPKVIPAGPQITRENVRDEINKLPSPDYGPQITWQNSMQAGPAAKAGSYAIGGKSAYTGGNSVESRKAQMERAEAAGIPLSTPDQGEAKQGLRTKMRGDYIRSGAAKAARDKVEADEAAKRYEKRAKAKAESDALRDSTYNAAEADIDLRTQRRRTAARVKGGEKIHGKSWMEHMEAGNLDASGNIKKDVQVGSTVEISLKSNVDTDAKTQTDKLASKADEYLKTSAETLKEMLSLMKKAGPGGQLTIG